MPWHIFTLGPIWPLLPIETVDHLPFLQTLFSPDFHKPVGFWFPSYCSYFSISFAGFSASFAWLSRHGVSQASLLDSLTPQSLGNLTTTDINYLCGSHLSPGSVCPDPTPELESCIPNCLPKGLLFSVPFNPDDVHSHHLFLHSCRNLWTGF